MSPASRVPQEHHTIDDHGHGQMGEYSTTRGPTWVWDLRQQRGDASTAALAQQHSAKRSLWNDHRGTAHYLEAISFTIFCFDPIHSSNSLVGEIGRAGRQRQWVARRSTETRAQY
jgi:hypothetical protein